MLPPYYEGRELPMDSLSPAEFEEFVFACLLLLQDVRISSADLSAAV